MKYNLYKIPSTQKTTMFSPGTPVSSTNKTDHHDMTEILLKVALKPIKPNQKSTYILYI
jgi:hypothetical protein